MTRCGSVVARRRVEGEAAWWTAVTGRSGDTRPGPSTYMQGPDPTPELSLPCGSHARKRQDKALARPVVEDVDILEDGGDGGLEEPSGSAADPGPPPKQLGGKSIDKVPEAKWQRWLDRKMKDEQKWLRTGGWNGGFYPKCKEFLKWERACQSVSGAGE